MNTQKNQKGFSLVEMLVSSVISMIIGGVIYTIFFMYSNQAGASVSQLLMQQQYDNVSRQISQDIRRASYVLGPGETPTSFSAGSDTVTSIAMCNSDGVVFAQYSISGTQLTEGSQQIPFQAGGSTVKVVTGASNFILGPQRRSVSINLSLFKNDLRTTHTISARRDVFQCRNRI
jgi:prepilin-type N-terminal cleavage/methylation domain-containing protein